MSARRMGRARALAAGATAVAVLAGACGGAGAHPQALAAGPASARPAGSPTPARSSDPARCPLTGTPAPGGVVPARPALAIKVGNNPSARPQSGLDRADVVFEVPIEGAITRLIAVYQCHGAGAVGPVRSTRWVDTQVLAQLGHAAFGFAGGIRPDQELVAASGLTDLNFFSYYNAYFRISSRLAPNNLYAATSTLWSLDPSRTPPAPLFTYSTAVPVGTPTTAATLSWSNIYSVTWSYQAGSASWARAVDSVAADNADGTPVTAANVVIERVATYPGPYAEDSQGTLGVRSVTVGSGSALVLRDGQAIAATWERPTLGAPTRLVDNATHREVALAPGTTWVELVPESGSVATSPGPAAG